MDTRTKIVEAAAPLHSGAIVTGYFDPVTVAHVRRLRQIREQCGSVTILLADPEDPILNARARAEVLAALVVVDFVVVPHEGLVFLSEEAADQVRFEQLVQHIHDRRGAAVQR